MIILDAANLKLNIVCLNQRVSKRTPISLESLLVQWDIGLLALCSQGQTALLQLRLGVIPVLVQNELLQYTNHICFNLPLFFFPQNPFL